MKNKINYGMSLFWKDIIWLLVFTGIFLSTFYFDKFIPEEWYSGSLIKFMAYLLSGMVLFMKIGMIYDAIAEDCGIAFKIIEYNDPWNPYKAKVFRPRFMWIIWWWAPLSKEYHHWKGKNFFGGPTGGGYSSEKEYKTEEKARKAIENYKRSSKDNRQYYMEKTERKIQRKIKV